MNQKLMNLDNDVIWVFTYDSPWNKTTEGGDVIDIYPKTVLHGFVVNEWRLLPHLRWKSEYTNWLVWIWRGDLGMNIRWHSLNTFGRKLSDLYHIFNCSTLNGWNLSFAINARCQTNCWSTSNLHIGAQNEETLLWNCMTFITFRAA